MLKRNLYIINKFWLIAALPLALFWKMRRSLVVLVNKVYILLSEGQCANGCLKLLRMLATLLKIRIDYIGLKESRKCIIIGLDGQNVLSCNFMSSIEMEKRGN